MPTVQLKRVYDDPAPEDGYRILVDRLWPRGLTHERADLDLWLKDVAPTPALRTEWHHEPDRFEEFADAYRAELDGEPDTRDALAELRLAIRVHDVVTLLFGARDLEVNHAVVLRDYLLAHPDPRSDAPDGEQPSADTSPEPTPAPVAPDGTPAQPQVNDLAALAVEHLERAHRAPAGRSATSIAHGREHALRQTLIALTAGSALADHDAPGEATLQVLRGHARLTTVTESWDLAYGALVAIPHERHGLSAIEDTVVLLTVVVTPHAG
ncbi:DUF488 family protein, N3 subclade [Miniimonas arenae]|uniref:DUF488 family protein, N3 subclade n=1 Tax=Miniimonas arenae TaxID=676201 RepID=UPI0028A99118|nr:DUF488 family protein [Miniimonas arenae]